MSLSAFSFFFFNDTSTTEIYTLSLHDALPICSGDDVAPRLGQLGDASLVEEHLVVPEHRHGTEHWQAVPLRSEEHTYELQSRLHLVCRLLLEKKKNKSNTNERTLGTLVF